MPKNYPPTKAPSKHLPLDRFSFPANITEIIKMILKKYGLTENEEKLFKKIMSGEITNNRKLANLLRDYKLGIVNKSNFSQKIKELFNLKNDEADNMAQELLNNILSAQIEKIKADNKPITPLNKKNILPTKKENLNQKPSKQPDKKDVYREILIEK